MGSVLNAIPGVVYMPQNWINQYTAAGIYTNETLIGAFRAAFERNSHRVALSEPNIEVTFAELDEISDRCAAALWRLGARPGERALFQMRNSKELIYAFFACLKIGVIPVCTLAAHRQAEIGYLGKHSEATLHFVHGDDERFDLVQFALEMREEIPTMRHILVAPVGKTSGGALDFMALAEQEEAHEARVLVDNISIDPYQVAVFQLSGGTSGVPKIIPRFNNEYRYTIQTVIDWMRFDETVVAFTPNPFMHNAPMAQYWGPALMVGGEVAITGRRSLKAIEEVFAERRPTWVALAKVHILRLAETGAFTRVPVDQIVGCVVTDSAQYLSKLMRAPCLPIFGMTEGLLCITKPGAPQEAIEGAVGQPLSPFDELRIVQPETETDVPFGEVGELLVRGPSLTRGYFRAPERNVDAFTSDGFYRSGDLLRFKEIMGQKYLVFEGRVKDVIDRGGEKINCSEVEDALGLHPGIGAVACVAMPDALYGEKMCAFIVPADGAVAPTVLGAGEFLRENGLAKFKWPERIEVVADLLMTTSGKVSKPLMRKMISEKLIEEAEIRTETE